MRILVRLEIAFLDDFQRCQLVFAIEKKRNAVSNDRAFSSTPTRLGPQSRRDCHFRFLKEAGEVKDVNRTQHP